MINVHDVIQIHPTHQWEGCYATVMDIGVGGVICFIEIPGGGKAHVRLTHDQYTVIGQAAFVPLDDRQPQAAH